MQNPYVHFVGHYNICKDRQSTQVYKCMKVDDSQLDNQRFDCMYQDKGQYIYFGCRLDLTGSLNSKNTLVDILHMDYQCIRLYIGKLRLHFVPGI